MKFSRKYRGRYRARTLTRRCQQVVRKVALKNTTTRSSKKKRRTKRRTTSRKRKHLPRGNRGVLWENTLQRHTKGGSPDSITSVNTGALKGTSEGVSEGVSAAHIPTSTFMRLKKPPPPPLPPGQLSWAQCRLEPTSSLIGRNWTDYGSTTNYSSTPSGMVSPDDYPTLKQLNKFIAQHPDRIIGSGISKTVYAYDDKWVFYIPDGKTPNTFETDKSILENISHLIPKTELVGSFQVSERCDIYGSKTMYEPSPEWEAWSSETQNMICKNTYNADKSRFIKYEKYYAALIQIADDLIKKNVLATDLHLNNVGFSITDEKRLIDTDGLYKIDVDDIKLKEKITFEKISGKLSAKFSEPYDIDTVLNMSGEHLKLHVYIAGISNDELGMAMRKYVEDMNKNPTPDDIRLHAFINHYIIGKHLQGGLIYLNTLDVYNKASPNIKKAADAFLTAVYGKMYTAEDKYERIMMSVTTTTVWADNELLNGAISTLAAALVIFELYYAFQGKSYFFPGLALHLITFSQAEKIKLLTDGLSQLTTDTNSYLKKIDTNKPPATKERVSDVKVLLESLISSNTILLETFKEEDTTPLKKLKDADDKTLIEWLNICENFINKYGTEYKLPGSRVFIDVDSIQIKKRLATLRNNMSSTSEEKE